MTLNPGDGMITMTTAGGASGLPATAQAMTLTLTPNVQGLALGNVTGPIDWACASNLNATATAKAMFVAAPGTLPARYAPSECR